MIVYKLTGNEHNFTGNQRKLKEYAARFPEALGSYRKHPEFSNEETTFNLSDVVKSFIKMSNIAGIESAEIKPITISIIQGDSK